jgi:parallel beta-helix repeat protein
MFKKIFFVLLAFLLLYGCYYWFSNRPDYYDPVREYVDKENELLRLFITAKDSSTIELPEGHYLLSKPLAISGLKEVTIKGKGIDKTVLSFKDQSQGAEGLRIDHSTNIVLEDFTVEDAAGDNIKVQETDGITFRRIKAAWTGKIGTENGAYGLYPVLCKQVLIEDCEVLGSSDAGIYVGQSSNVIIRNNKAYKNVAGIESENSKDVSIYGNHAYDNTGGILVFDLPGLTTYGHSIKVYDNKVYNNNRSNFGTKGAIVSNIPSGTGMLILATEKVDIFRNTISNHKTLGLGIISYDLVFGMEKDHGSADLVNAYGGVRAVTDYRKDTLYDPYPSHINISDNKYENKYWIPNLSSDFGKLFIFKNWGEIPDVVYDGIYPDERGIPNICIQDTEMKYLQLDAENDFEGLTKEIDQSLCGE